MNARRRGPDAPQAPVVGRIARLAGPLRVDGVFWYRLHAFGARIVPDPLARVLMPLFVALFTVALVRIGRAIVSNLEPLLGPAGPLEARRRAHRTFREFAWCVTERYEWLGVERPARGEVRVERLEVWRDLETSESGRIVVTAHIGTWEFGSAMPATREGRRVHLVREAEADPKAQEFVRRLLEERGGDLYRTHFATDDPKLGLELLDALRAGDVVALQGDRPRRGGATIEASLFGRPYEVPVGPFALARLAEVPIVPVFMFREGRRRYRLAFRDPIRVAPGGDRRAATAAAAQAFAADLEWAIREHPHQWFCFRELWPAAGQSGRSTKVANTPSAADSPSAKASKR